MNTKGPDWNCPLTGKDCTGDKCACWQVATAEVKNFSTFFDLPIIRRFVSKTPAGCREYNRYVEIDRLDNPTGKGN